MFGSADVEKNFINMQQGISGSSSGQNIAPAQEQGIRRFYSEKLGNDFGG